MRFDNNLSEISAKIQLLKKTAGELERLGENFPALEKNIARILASLKMLELNISDIVDLSPDR